MSSVPKEGRSNIIRHHFCNENIRPSRPSFRPGRGFRPGPGPGLAKFPTWQVSMCVCAADNKLLCVQVNICVCVCASKNISVGNVGILCTIKKRMTSGGNK